MEIRVNSYSEVPKKAKDAKGTRDFFKVELRKEKNDHIFNKNRFKHVQKISNDSMASHYGSLSNQNEAFFVDLSSQINIALKNDDLITVEFLVFKVRYELSQIGSPPAARVVAAGIHKQLLHFLTSPYKIHQKLQVNCAWSLSNIAGAGKDQGDCVGPLIGEGFMSVFLEILESPDIELAEQALWGLGNICYHSQHIRDLLVENNFIDALDLFSQREDLTEDLIDHWVWCVAALFEFNPVPEFPYVYSLLAKVNDFTETYFAKTGFWSVCILCNFLEGSEDEEINECICFTNIIHFAADVICTKDEKNEELLLNSLQLIGTLASCSYESVLDSLLEIPQILKGLYFCLLTKNEEIQREAIWALSNCLGGTAEQVRKVNTQNNLILPKLLELMDSQNPKVLELLW